jgi:hypothetical protein
MTHGPEKKVKDAIRALLNSVGAYYYMPVPVGFGRQTLDFLVCWRGAFYGIEAKRADGRGRVTPRQETCMREIAEAGGGACIEDTIECINVRRMMGI